MTPSPNDLTRQQLDELDALLQKMLAVPIAPSEPVPAPRAYVPEPPLPSQHWRTDPPSPAPTRQPHIAPVPSHSEPAYAGVVRPERESVILETRVDPRSYLRMEPTPAAAAPAPRLFGHADPMAAPSESTFVPPPVQQRSTFTEPTGPASFDESEAEDTSITVEPPALTFQPATDISYTTTDDTAAVPLTVAGETGTIGSTSKVPAPLLPVYGVNSVLEFVLCLFGPPGEFFTQPAVKWALGLCGIGLLGTAAAWTARGMGWVNW